MNKGRVRITSDEKYLTVKKEEKISEEKDLTIIIYCEDRVADCMYAL